MSFLLFDTIRFVHLLAVIIGFGVSFFADVMILRTLRSRVDRHTLATIALQHRIVLSALAVMWASGLTLVWLRTGFDAGQISPKVYGKLLVVTLLTLNAFVIGGFAMPLLERLEESNLLDLPLGRRLPLACIAAISGASWITALAFGVSDELAKAPAMTIENVILLTFGGVLVFACILAVGVSRRRAG